MPCSHLFSCVVTADIYYAGLELVGEDVLADGALGHNVDLQGSASVQSHTFLCGLGEACKSASADGEQQLLGVL